MILVTGGTGLIGSHLLYNLVSSGKKVKALKRKTSNIQNTLKTFSYYSEKPDSLFSKIEWVDGDILDYDSIESLMKGVTEVYHCAAIVSFSKSDHKQMIYSNVEGTAIMIDAAVNAGVKKFCHVSSVAALGNSPDGNINERTNWQAGKKPTAYSQSKFYSEMEVWRGIEEGLNAVIVNPSIVLGPGNWNSGSSKLFTTVWNGLKFYTKGVTGYVDARDVTKAMILLMDDKNFDSCKNSRYLLNAGNLSYRQLFNEIAEALGKPKPKFYAPPLLTGIAWRATTLFKLFSKKDSGITRETAKSAHSRKNFNGSKIERKIGFNYLPLPETIKHTAEILKEEMVK